MCSNNYGMLPLCLECLAAKLLVMGLHCYLSMSLFYRIIQANWLYMCMHECTIRSNSRMINRRTMSWRRLCGVMHATLNFRCALAQAVQAAQVTTEDYAMSSVHLEPLTVVGVEGLLGTAALLLILMPIVQARRAL